MRRSSLLAALAAIALAGSSCGRSADPIRIGVLVDCTGIIAASHDPALAAAELPLLQRGGRLRGHGPNSGVTGATIAGRPVELVQGCTESGVYSRLIAETERLIDTDHVDVIVGATGWGDGIIMRELAHRHPTIPFVVAASWAGEVTLHDPAANLYRFVPSVEQAQAGLATYAYRTLGWRRAATVAEDEPNGWGASAAFAAEFCSLGGTVKPVWTPAFLGSAALVRKLPQPIDGVVVTEDYGLSNPAGFLREYVATHPDARRRLLLSMWMYGPGDLRDMRAVWPRLKGVTAAFSGVPDPESPGMTAYLRAYRHWFPGLPLSGATNSDVAPYRDAIAGVLSAIAAVHGRFGTDHAALRSALARVRVGTTAGPVRIGPGHQAVAAIPLVRIDGDAHGEPRFHLVRTTPGVDQTVGGLFGPDDAPSRTASRCAGQAPPPWAG